MHVPYLTLMEAWLAHRHSAGNDLEVHQWSRNNASHAPSSRCPPPCPLLSRAKPSSSAPAKGTTQHQRNKQGLVGAYGRSPAPVAGFTSPHHLRSRPADPLGKLCFSQRLASPSARNRSGRLHGRVRGREPKCCTGKGKKERLV